MRRWRWGRITALTLLAFAGSLLLTGCSRDDVESKLRFGWPTGVTKQARDMRVLWTWSSVAALAVGALVWGLIFWCCGRYRKRNDELPRQTKYNLPLEIIYTVVPFMIIGALFYRTVVVEDDVNKLTPNPDVVVQVNAFKWNWQFEYHNHLNAQGQRVNDAYPGVQGPGGQPVYLNTIGTSNEIPILVLPVNKKVRIVEHSEDVIHSFWVPEFLFKRDVIPHGTTSTSKDNQFEITATSEGRFVGRCAELCGTYHSQMNFEVRIVSDAQYQAYLTELAKLGPNDAGRQWQALAAIGQPPCATTTEPFDTSRTTSIATKGTICEQPG